MDDAGDPNVPPPKADGNVTRFHSGGKDIVLLGTAHVSRKSVDEVQATIAELRPDTVCVELDRARYDTLVNEARLGRVDVRTILAEDRAGLYLSSLLFAGFQKRLGDRLGVRPGAEMLAGVEAADRIGAKVVLADRNVQITLMRCYRSLGWLEKVQILAVLVMLPFTAGDVDEAEVEKLKDRRAIGDVMTAFAEQMPALKAPLIDERDRYLAASIMKADGRRVVAVVGAAHVPGIERHLGGDTDTSELEVIPRAGMGGLGALFQIAALSLITFIALRAPPAHRIEALERWIGSVTTGAALFAVIAGASVVTAAACALLAPLSALVPFVPFGRAVGRLQARLRPPLPADGARARDDILKPRNARRNRFLRPLLVAVFASFGRALGSGVGLAWALAHVLF